MVLLRWFPDRHFLFAGDDGYGMHELARRCGPAAPALDLGQPFYADANLYYEPPLAPAA